MEDNPLNMMTKTLPTTKFGLVVDFIGHSPISKSVLQVCWGEGEVFKVIVCDLHNKGDREFHN